MNITIPTLITLFRLILTAVFVALALFYPHNSPLPAIIFIIAALSDALDGYIARTYNMSSKLGACLDPIADKILVTAALILLVAINPSPLFIIGAILIVSREFLVSGLREWMAIIGHHNVVSVSWIGRIKTLAQMFGISGCLLGNAYNFPLFGNIGMLLLLIAIVLTLVSMVTYIHMSWKHLTNDDMTS